MRYVDARFEAFRREDLYRMYSTDTMYYQGEQKRLTVRYTDIVNGTLPEKDERTGDEIAEDFIARFGITEDGGENNGFA